MIGLAQLVRSEADYETDIPYSLSFSERRELPGLDDWEGTYTTRRVSWRRQDLAEISVSVTATLQLSGLWVVYASIDAFCVDTFGNASGGCLGDSSAFSGVSGQDHCQEADVEAVAAAALEAAITDALDLPDLYPFFGPMERMRWLVALATPPRDLG